MLTRYPLCRARKSHFIYELSYTSDFGLRLKPHRGGEWNVKFYWQFSDPDNWESIYTSFFVCTSFYFFFFSFVILPLLLPSCTMFFFFIFSISFFSSFPFYSSFSSYYCYYCHHPRIHTTLLTATITFSSLFLFQSPFILSLFPSSASWHTHTFRSGPKVTNHVFSPLWNFMLQRNSSPSKRPSLYLRTVSWWRGWRSIEVPCVVYLRTYWQKESAVRPVCCSALKLF